MTKTILPVKVMADLITPKGDKYVGVLPMTISIEEGVITVGSHNGPDLWRAKLKEIS